jgi:hypothetical protein
LGTIRCHSGMCSSGKRMPDGLRSSSSSAPFRANRRIRQALVCLACDFSILPTSRSRLGVSAPPLENPVKFQATEKLLDVRLDDVEFHSKLIAELFDDARKRVSPV